MCNRHAICHTYGWGNLSHVYSKGVGMRYGHIAITDVMGTEYKPIGRTWNIRFRSTCILHVITAHVDILCQRAPDLLMCFKTWEQKTLTSTPKRIPLHFHSLMIQFLQCYQNIASQIILHRAHHWDLTSPPAIALLSFTTSMFISYRFHPYSCGIMLTMTGVNGLLLTYDQAMMRKHILSA